MPESRAFARAVHPAYFALLVLLTAHVAFTLLIVPPATVFGGEPIANADYALHFSRAAAADEFLTRAGHAWGYDPYFMAGYPMGTVLDVNHKLVELLVHGLHRVGLSLPTAFNLLVFLGVLLVPVVTWLGARVLGLGPWEQLGTAALATTLWVLDSEISKSWRIGVLASGVAMYSLPLALASTHRFLEDRKVSRFLSVALVCCILSLLHPLSFLFLSVAMIPVLILAHRTLDRRFWVALGGLATLVLLLNLFWIVPFLRDLRFKTTSGYHWIGDVRQLAKDLFGTRDSGLRMAVTLLAVGGFVQWWREGHHERVRLILPSAVGLTCLGYFAGEIPALRDLETYRSALMASFVLCLPAASCVGLVVPTIAPMEPRRRLVGAVVISVLALNLTGRNLARLAPLLEGSRSSYSLGPLGKDEMTALQWLRLHANPQRRVMVEYWPLGALVPWYTGLEVIGGPYPFVWLQHNFANFASLMEVGGGVRLFGRLIGEFSPPDLRAYLDAYNVGWVVAYTDPSREVFDRASWLQPLQTVGGYRIYENRDASGPMLRGSGTVTAGYDGLRVGGASLGDLLLKYHWLPSLVSDPPQPIEPEKVLDDPVPFVRIAHNRFSDFVIRN